jgi:methyl halide transferase
VGTPGDYLDFVRQRYVDGDAPWDSGRPSSELIRVVQAGLLPGQTALEFGCGTGTNAVELARRGYQVTAVDLVDVAIDRAREKARRDGMTIDFRLGDLTQLNLGGPYDVLFDRGVYHTIRMRNLPGFLTTLQRVTRQGSRWLSLAGNPREPREAGPPTVREEEIRSELGPLFNILDLHEFRFDLGQNFRPLAWSILMERR